MTTITAVEVIARAESDLKKVLGDPAASGEQVRKAEDAVIVARRTAAEEVELARTRQRIQNELDAEARAQEKARRQRLADETLAALATEAPTVTLRYRHMTITIKLSTVTDPAVREQIRHGVRLAVDLLDRRFSDHVEVTRNQILSGVQSNGDYIDRSFYDYLMDALRHAFRHGAVTVQVGAEETEQC
jgi:hypothetical protein